MLESTKDVRHHRVGKAADLEWSVVDVDPAKTISDIRQNRDRPSRTASATDAKKAVDSVKGCVAASKFHAGIRRRVRIFLSER